MRRCVLHNNQSIEWYAKQRNEMNEVFYQNLRQRYEIIIEDKIADNTLQKNK